MRILAIGWDIEGPGVEKASLHDADSLASYDVVLIDPLAIPDLWLPYVPPDRDGVRRLFPDRDGGLSRALENLFSARRRELEGLLRAGGAVLVRLRPPGEPVEIVPPHGPARRVDAYSFLPSFSLAQERRFLPFPRGVRVFPRKGKDIQGLDLSHPLAGYLLGVRRYEAVIVSPMGVPLEGFGQVLLRNRIGDVLAWDLRPGEGRLIFLPPTDAPSGEEGERLLLGLYSLLEEIPPAGARPEWLSRYLLPPEEELRRELEVVSAELAELERRRDGIREKLREYESLKGLLYPAGTGGLLRAAMKAFGYLGFEVSPDEVDPQSFRVSAPEGKGFVRVAWSPRGAVATGPYRPLLLALDHLRHERGESLHGVMLVAAETSLDPKRRGPRYTESLRRACEEHGISLVPGEELFAAVQAVLAGADPVPVRRSLLSTSGPWRWRD